MGLRILEEIVPFSFVDIIVTMVYSVRGVCGMALRVSPNIKEQGRLRQLQFRQEERDRIIRIINWIKKVASQSRQVE